MKLVTIEQPDTDEERYLKGILAELHRAYLAEAKPYIDRLAGLRAMRTPKMFAICEEGDEAIVEAIANRSAAITKAPA